MTSGVIDSYKQIDEKFIKSIHLSIYESAIALGCFLTAIIMFVRVFYGTELTDEAYYVSDALTMMHGNVYYAYNNYSYGTGGVFLMIPFLFIYELFVPNNAGVLLYTRICFILFWDALMLIAYRILIKDFKKSSALLITGFMLAFAGGGALFNFSYNTVPCAMAYISGLTIYDAIEHENKYSRLKLFFSGFLMAIAVLGHLGYGVAVLTFLAVIVVRTKESKKKARSLGLFAAGGFTEILFVVIPVITQTSLSTLLAGINNKLHPYPTGNMYQGTTADKLTVVFTVYKKCVPVLIFVFLFVFFISIRYIRENEKKLSKRGYVIMSLSAAFFLITMYFCLAQAKTNSAIVNWYWGFLASVGVLILFLIKEFKRFPLIFYLGLYPIIFAYASTIGIDSSASTGRFVVAFPAMAMYFLVILNEESELARLLVTVSVVACIVAIGINNYIYIYRDEHFSALGHKVESGVYKGLYTTEARAHDLPELEEYLNSIVKEDEYYAFRDNVPAGYLMMHTGVMCDKDTWDPLNYSYHKNAPANLYEFYQRRGAFPQKYIYVDYGRDPNLSIEDPEYKFNEFINSYYKKTADFALDETFYHIMVYEYKGGFDGDFDYWIDRHMIRGD